MLFVIFKVHKVVLSGIWNNGFSVYFFFIKYYHNFVYVTFSAVFTVYILTRKAFEIMTMKEKYCYECFTSNTTETFHAIINRYKICINTECVQMEYFGLINILFFFIYVN